MVFKGEFGDQVWKSPEIPYTEESLIHFVNPKSKSPQFWPLMLGIPTTGLVRFEWHISSQQAVIPIAMSLRSNVQRLQLNAPMGFHVAEARNLVVRDFIASPCEWLFFIDHDVLLHRFTYPMILDWMQKKTHPIVCGLYYSKSLPSLPLVFRGRGGGPYMDWKQDDRVEVDCVPMGCTLIHRSILEYMYQNSRTVQTRDGDKVQEVFRSPKDIFFDPEEMEIGIKMGTEDFWFCDRILDEDILAKTGWEELSEKPNPFICDTRIRCGHIDNDGMIFPPHGDLK